MITIKKCQDHELNLLHEIAIQSYNETYQYLWSDSGASYLNEFYKKETFKKELSTSNIFYYLVYDTDKAIGYFKLKENEIAPYPVEHCTEIEKFYLLKEYTGKGIGKIIMEFIIALSKEKHRPVLWLKVMESSPAKYLYEKYGLIQTNINYLNYPAMIEKYRSIITMARIFEQ